MSRRPNLADRARAISGARAAGADPATPAPEPAAPDVSTSVTQQVRKAPAAAPRTKPVRITTDLSPVAYRRFRAWLGETADDLGVANISGSDVVRLLVDQLVDDPGLAAAVRAELARRQRR
jgi:hypothetical protein